MSADPETAEPKPPEASEAAAEEPKPEPKIEQLSETPRLVPPKAEVKSDALKVAPDTAFTGALLRQIRESQRISLKEISERTKISVASLAALEEERFEDLPNARVYIRGFVRCLAQEIGLDQSHVSTTYVPRWERWFESQAH